MSFHDLIALQRFQMDIKPPKPMEVLKHLHRLWGFDIHLETLQGDQVMKTHHVPPKSEHADSEYPR
ncbi:SpoVR family protein, partial [Pseudomonas quasicaspiana]|nr:SpoVR family protein [Pseudomonas quasicaspiana]